MYFCCLFAEQKLEMMPSARAFCVSRPLVRVTAAVLLMSLCSAHAAPSLTESPPAAEGGEKKKTDLATVKFHGDYIDTGDSIGEFAERSTILRKILMDYDKSDPPKWGKGPVDVKVGVRVSRLTAVDTFDNSFSIDYYYRLHWEDERIVIKESDNLGPIKVFTLSDTDEKKQLIWRPDVAFINVLSTKLNGVTTFITNKMQILWVRHLYSTFAATYDFSYFPFGE
jgi:hypothetical protein